MEPRCAQAWRTIAPRRTHPPPPEYWDSVDEHSNAFASCVRDPWGIQDLTLGASVGSPFLSVRREIEMIQREITTLLLT